MSDSSGSAFPEIKTDIVQQYESRVYSVGGMALRDYFAAKALPSVFKDAKKGTCFDEIAREAYMMADAMLEARK